MAEPTVIPAQRTWVARTGTSYEVSGETHTITVTALSFELNVSLDETKKNLIVASSSGTGALSKIYSGSPSSGQILINHNNNTCTCHADDVGTITITYWGDGSHVGAQALNDMVEATEKAYKAARPGHISKTDGEDNKFDVDAGNFYSASTDISGMSYAGDTDVDLDLICDAHGTAASKWVKILLGITENTPGVGKLSTSVSADCDTEGAAEVVAVIAIANCVPIGHIIYRNDHALIDDADHICNYDGRVFGSDSAGKTVIENVTVDEGDNVRGQQVYFDSDNHVSKAVNTSEATLADGIISLVTGTTTCQVQTGGSFTYETGDIDHNVFINATAKMYLTANAGHASEDQDITAGRWTQNMGKVFDTNYVDLNYPGFISLNDGDDPIEGQYRHDGSAALGESMRPKVSTDDEKWVEQADSDDGVNIDAIGVVTAVDGNYCTVKDRFLWKTADFGGTKPCSLNGGGAGDKFFMHTSAGQGTFTENIAPDIWNQEMGYQKNAGETLFEIYMKPGSLGGTEDPYEFECSSVDKHDAVYAHPLTGVLYEAESDNDDHVNVVGIVKSINAAGTRCNIYRPGDVVPDGNNYVGKLYLNPDAAATPNYSVNEDKQPGNWSILIGQPRGANETGFLVDIQTTGIYGKNGRIGVGKEGCVRAWSNPAGIAMSKAVDFGTVDPTMEHYYVQLTSRTSANRIRGVAEETSVVDYWNTQGRGADDNREIVLVRVQDIHFNPAVTWPDIGTYFSSTLGGFVAAVAPGSWQKRVCTRAENDHTILVCPEMQGWIPADGPWEPVAERSYIAPCDPPAEPHGYDPMRSWDTSDAVSKLTNKFTSKHIIIQATTAIASSVLCFAQSVGVGATSYTEFDLRKIHGAADESVLSTTGKLVGLADAPRGNTTDDATYGTGAGHIAAVLDATKFPLVKGDVLYWTADPDGGDAHGTDPYGVGILLNMYGIKS
ncbi:MAG: hypothetical protein JRI80_00190 [Deltaproteobacteria bacterium]|nr:hypothetical protein [Deltaproteobacteria bacterium]